MSVSFLKRSFVAIAALPPFPTLLERMLNRGPAIFTLHRFQNRDLGIDGHEQQVLRADLALVRRLGYRVLPVQDFIAAAVDGSLPARSVSFTVDDGYADFITHGAPVFAEFDCPVTIFATTGFVDGAIWFWWDQLEYVFETTRATSLTVDVDGVGQRYSWQTASQRQSSWLSLLMLLKRFPIDVQRRALADVVAALEVEVPATPPEKYAPMRWKDCNALAGRAVSIGPHTVTHPNLARIASDESRTEIGESWRRIREVAVAPVPIFCYPYGDPSAFGRREQDFVRTAGLNGALSFIDGRVSVPSSAQAGVQFALPRLRYPNDTHQFAQLLLGLDLLKRGRHASAPQPQQT